MINTKQYNIILSFLIIVFAIFAGFITFRASWMNNDQHFTLLAKSFLGNDLYLSPINLPPGDFADFKGKQYIFYGPLPAIILISFVFSISLIFALRSLTDSRAFVSFSLSFFFETISLRIPMKGF